jgi:hypothetical protein
MSAHFTAQGGTPRPEAAGGDWPLFAVTHEGVHVYILIVNDDNNNKFWQRRRGTTTATAA